MKLAIPTRDGMVDDHFGHCAYYTLIEIDENNRIVSTETVESPEGCGCKSEIASTLHGKGVTVMLAGNIGQGAVNKLGESRITVIRGCKGNIREVTEAYLNGKLEDNAQVCDHHDCSHHGHQEPESILQKSPKTVKKYNLFG